MKKMLVMFLSIISMVSMIGCSKQDLEVAEQVIAENVTEEVESNLQKWSKKISHIDGNSDDYVKRMRYYHINDFREAKVKIEECEDDSSKYEMYVLFNYDTKDEKQMFFDILVDKNVKLADIDLSNISSIRGVEIVKMSLHKYGEIEKLYVKEGYNGYNTKEKYDERIEVLALNGDFYPPAEEYLNRELNVCLGNLEVVDSPF